MSTQFEYKGRTGWCAANYTETDIYDDQRCGPIRDAIEEAVEDQQDENFEGIRYVHTDGYLYVDQPEAGAE